MNVIYCYLILINSSLTCKLIHLSIPICREQLKLKEQLISEDDIDWKNSEEDFSGLHLVGGLDISFPKDDFTHACPCFVVLSFPDLKVNYYLIHACFTSFASYYALIVLNTMTL